MRSCCGRPAGKSTRPAGVRLSRSTLPLRHRPCGRSRSWSPIGCVGARRGSSKCAVCSSHAHAARGRPHAFTGVERSIGRGRQAQTTTLRQTNCRNLAGRAAPVLVLQAPRFASVGATRFGIADVVAHSQSPQRFGGAPQVTDGGTKSGIAPMIRARLPAIRPQGAGSIWCQLHPCFGQSPVARDTPRVLM